MSEQPFLKTRLWHLANYDGDHLRQEDRLLMCEAADKLEQLQSQVNAVHAIADEMANQECEANEVDDCDICQGYIKYANAIKAAIKGEEQKK